MDCREAREQIAEFVVGALASERARAVESHIALCDECRRERDALVEAGRHVDALPMVAPRRDLWPSVARQLEPRRRDERLRRLVFGLRPGWAFAAAACSVLLLALVIVTTGAPSLPTAPPMLGEIVAAADAPLMARWNIEAGLAAGATDRYSAAVALASLPEPTEEDAEP